jgi:hypothetical protein
MIFKEMTYVMLSVKASFMSMITFVKIVALCDLWLVIAYASAIGNDALK